MNLLILPTGALLAIGGVSAQHGASWDIYSPQLFENGQWTTLPPNPTSSRRDYHSTAILLPDGRVFLGGGNARTYDYEIFSPAYMEKPNNRPQGLTWQAPVPIPDAATGALLLNYDERYTITCNPLPLGHALSKVVLTAPCSVTRHSDMHQRYIELQAGVDGGNQISFYAPATEPEAPRGIYMLWLVTNSGYVSYAEWVVLR